MASSASLIEDISVELLVCHLCLDQLRFPKTLSCRHSFCEQCLRHLGTYPADDDEPRHRSRRSSRLTCPVCYESCLLPAGGVSRLPDDPVVTQLCSIIERRKSSAQQLGVGAETACQICSRSTAGERHRSAHVKCVECGKMMCSACARLHRRTAVTSGHSLLDIDDSDLSTECAHHSGEPVRFYCDTCDECVCVLCTFRGQPHSHDHNVLSFSDAASLHKTPLAALLADCRQRLRNARTRYDAVVAFDQLIRKVEDNIHEVATETVSYVRRQERQLVAALHAACSVDDADADTIVACKKTMSEYVRRLEDACDAADKVLGALGEGGGPAAFLLRRRRTVDTMTSLMTSHTSGVGDWPACGDRQVRFEAYGLESARGLHVGRLIIDEQDIVQQRQTDGAVAEVKLRDVGVQTDELGELVASSSRCEASGSVAVASSRVSANHELDQRVMTTTGRYPPSSSSFSSSLAGPGAGGLARTLSEHRPSVCDASTSTPSVNLVSSSTVTEKLHISHQSTCTDSFSVETRDQETDTEPRNLEHRATETEQPRTTSVGVTATPLTGDQSTSTDQTLPRMNDDAENDTELTTSLAKSGDDEVLQESREWSSSQVAGYSLMSAPLMSMQSALPSSDNSKSSSAELRAGIAQQAPAVMTDDGEHYDAAPQRFFAMLPEIERTADVLAASHFSSGLTARLLREVVDVGLQMTSSTGRRQTRDAETSTDHDVKWTQAERDVVDRGVGLSNIITTDVSTLANLASVTFDKETSTTRVQQMNKNVGTESTSTADKQTCMSSDVTSAYLACTGATSRRVVTVSRGTNTPFAFTEAQPQHLVDRATSPTSFGGHTEDRATSPVRVMCVDKAVTASKAEALEPVDTFQAAGQLSGPLSPRTRRPLSLSPRSKLACISETVEHCDEEKAEELDDGAELSSVSESPCRLKTPTASPQRPPLSRNIFNFDHAIASRLAATSQQRPHSVSDDLTTSSVTGGDANSSEFAPAQNTDTVHPSPDNN